MNHKDSSARKLPKRPSKSPWRLHQETCGTSARLEYDDYSDVRAACERKLAEWERQGVLASQSALARESNNWLFTPR